MKATLPDGTLFEGTTDEYLAIRGQSVSSNGHGTAPRATDAPTVWNSRNARKFWDSLDKRHRGGRQKELLQFLIRNGGKANEDQVWKLLGIKKGQQLAGVLANVTRNARRETKDDDARAIAWVFDDKGDCHYYIPGDAITFLRNIEEAK